MTSFCKTKVPQEMWDELRPIKDDDEAVKNWGIVYMTKLCRCGLGVCARVWEGRERGRDDSLSSLLPLSSCRRLLDSGATRCIHFYTLNLEKSVRLILESLGMTHTASTRRQFPWRSSKLSTRAGQ